MPNFATTYLGNVANGDRAYSGMIREFRIWNEYRNDKDIFQYRYIEIKNNRVNLLYYYKMVGGETDNLSVKEWLS